MDFQAKIKDYKAAGKQLIYLDESGFAQDMPRTHGYAPRGQRCHDQHDWHAKGRINAIGAICEFKFVTLGLFETTINSDVFYAWLTQDYPKYLMMPSSSWTMLLFISAPI